MQQRDGTVSSRLKKIQKNKNIQRQNYKEATASRPQGVQNTVSNPALWHPLLTAGRTTLQA